jgi:PAS domain S-box-containing protein
MAHSLDYQRLLNSVDAPLVAVDRSCRITAFNRAAERLTGYRASDILDRPCTTLFPGNGCDPICRMTAHADHAEARHATTILRRDGVAIDVNVTTTPLFDERSRVVGALETIHPSSNREALTETLIQEESHKHLILDSLMEGVVTIDQEWRITSFNAAAERILGYPAAAALGKFCNHLLRSDRCQEGCPLTRMLESEAPSRDERIRLTHADGRGVEVTVTTAVLKDGNGEARGGVMTFRDERAPQRERELGPSFMGLACQSPSMRSVCTLIQDVAESTSTVLITGESGTGKEMVANAIQQLGSRRNAPYVKVNCAAIPDGLLESELFGHVRGAFTDAKRDHRGRFELAHKGILFLDEIGDLSPHVQVKLLRVLQDRRFERVGGEETVEVDVRLIAATHRSLEELVRCGGFREDLYYRLNVIPLRLPPLRERLEDIPTLVAEMVEKHGGRTDKRVDRVTDEALAVLTAYPWPGNVRELENAIEYAFVRTHGPSITPAALPVHVTGRTEGSPEATSDAETDRLVAALERHHWHHGHAAQELGISRTTLWRRMRRLGLVNDSTTS